MSTIVPQHRSFLCVCDLCHEHCDLAEENLTGGTYCPKCRATIEAANANPATDVGALLDEIGRNRYKALYALYGGK